MMAVVKAAPASRRGACVVRGKTQVFGTFLSLRLRILLLCGQRILRFRFVLQEKEAVFTSIRLQSYIFCVK